MAITAGEQQSGGEVRDNDGRLIIVGPGGVAIGGGGGAVDITDRAGRLLGHVTVDNFPGTQPVSGPLTDAQLRALAVAVSGPLTDAQLRASAVPVSGTFFQGTQPVSGTVTANQGTPNSAANKWPTSVTDGTNTAQVLNAAPGSDTGQSAMAVRVISQLGAGSGGGGGTSQADKSAFVEGTGLVSPAGGVVNDTISADPAEDTAAALRLTVKRGLHINLRNVAGTEVGTAAAPIRTDPTGGTAQPVTGAFFQATQPVSLATNTPDVTDRDARLAGRVKNLDSAGTVIDPALKGQLPAALVGGRLDINLGAISGSNIPVANVETLADNAAFVDGTSKVFPQGYIFDEVAGTALTENDVGAARMDSKRSVVNVIEDAVTRGRRATVSATGGLLGDQGAPAAQANAWYVRPRRLVTYRAMFRTTTRPFPLSNAFAAAGRKQYATIFHAASATKTVKLVDVLVQIQTISTTAIMVAELVRLTAATTPATGNPAITPGKTNTADAAAEATTLALPTTAGTESDILGSNYWLIAGPSAGGTASVVNWTQWVSLVNPVGAPPREDAELTMRAGVAEGFAVTIDVDRLANPAFQILMIFSEE